ncbi:MAG TPA: TIGR00269 family protein [Anaerolineales bacterium]
MKCRICGEKASVNMREHKLALCKEHYLEWVPAQAERSIKKYGLFTHNEKILVAVSGGKDSLSLWDILQRLDYHAEGLYICLGIDEGISYSTESQRLAEKFASEHNLKLNVVDIQKEYGATLPQITRETHRGRIKPCSVCGLVKRHVLNRVARDLAFDVLATGHNLDDEAAVLFGNTLSWSGEYMLRQGPMLPGSSGLARKVKPLCRLYEREMLAYALLRGIEYIYEECPYSRGSTSIYYKELLNRLENDRPGAKLSFYLSFLEARKTGLFTEREKIQAELHPCFRCGQPTSAPGLCSFCRLMERINPLPVHEGKI